ncbi:branched-chain amino acid ABC transporter permease [Rhodococcus qingshengii]|jgi:branched-chain amino acid transport system permease protein|uniref:branched-chain amino acid ABC transporter permease n=1 Tax=Rhodococcus TaxID=1827 RepID=UPI0005A5D373|nr:MULTISPECIES: branched-chain amino acid ABC transporter permease [Rhodococcus]MCE4268425.1 branched-chain amino acid ABC transporter permease [Rhodococcus globerulus]MDJ0490689.1 branched-chain amino acid ABC transporter permease [Rhodococcus qingshengii]
MNISTEAPISEPTENLVAPPKPATFGLDRSLVVRGTIIAGIVLAAGLAIPYVVLDTYYITMLFDGLILGMLALSIGFLARHLGLISLGHVAFFGGAAYAVGMAITHWGWAPLPAAMFGVAAGSVLALLMGLLVVRASGMGFLMLTLALGQALYQISIQRVAIPYTGAFDGLQLTYSSTATFLGFDKKDIMNAALFWPVVWVTLVLATYALWVVGRSKFGVVLEGIRENEERMRFSGFNTFRPRLIAFVLSGVVASVAGVLFALNAAYVSPEVLSFLKAGDSLTATIIGGMGTLLGPLVGGLLYVVAQAEFNTSGNLHLYTGIALILVLMFLPGGITGGIASLWNKVRGKITKGKGE